MSGGEGGAEASAPSASRDIDWAYLLMVEALGNVCSAYDVRIGAFVHRHEQMVGYYLQCKLDLFFTDLPNNVRADQSRSNSDNEVLQKADMDVMLLLMGDVLRKGGHGHVLC